MIQKSKKKLKYLENEKSFWAEIEDIFHFLEGFQLSKIVSESRVHL